MRNQRNNTNERMATIPSVVGGALGALYSNVTLAAVSLGSMVTNNDKMFETLFFAAVGSLAGFLCSKLWGFIWRKCFPKQHAKQQAKKKGLNDKNIII